jgi:hypothetical protein
MDMKHRQTDTATLVGREVRRLLETSPAYRRLPAPAQQSVARDTARIAVYLVEPEGMRATDLPGAVAPLAGLVAEIDFPAFVSSLIDGVFQAIVDASIEQMRAYAELVRNVAQTVDQFASAATSDEAARHWLATTYADCFELDTRTGKLRLRTGVDCADNLPRLRLLTRQKSLRKLGPNDVEKKLVPAARRGMAAGRQQLLAAMTLMGINRIVVTDGRIREKGSPVRHDP